MAKLHIPAQREHFSVIVRNGCSNGRNECSQCQNVNNKITEEGVTQKQKLIKGVIDLLQDVLNKNPKTTVVDEVSTDNWSIAGEYVTARRKRSE